jgi:hypothetical protein
MQSVGVIRQLRRYPVKSNPHAISAPARDPSSSVLNSGYNLRGRAFSIENWNGLATYSGFPDCPIRRSRCVSLTRQTFTSYQAR